MSGIAVFSLFAIGYVMLAINNRKQGSTGLSWACIVLAVVCVIVVLVQLLA